MPVITFEYQDFISLLGQSIPKDKLIDTLPLIGADLDRVEGDTIHMEFFPNRPDLTSIEGIVRACRAFFNIKPGLTRYAMKPSEIQTNVENSVVAVRPQIATAFVSNITMTDELIKSLMELQEKLHRGIGRNRKKLAIGVHDFSGVTPPFTYKAVQPDSTQFIPLGKSKQLTLSEILTTHEKGQQYRHLLEGFDHYPLITDAHDNVLSFPPVINGTLTQVNPQTKDLFIDVTGTDHTAVHYALNIIATALAERGGILHSTTVKTDKGARTYPDLTPETMTITISDINNLLGTHCTQNEIITALHRMGYQAESKSETVIEVLVPAWRADILHPVDIIEDVAIGYGYDQFTSAYPKSLTFGSKKKQQSLINACREIMIGLGFNEVTTFTITNKKQEFSSMGLDVEPCVEIKNPIGEDYSILRKTLLPSILAILEENKHYPLPQKIFEVGQIIDDNNKNQDHLAAVQIDAKANFTLCKSLVDAIARELDSSFSYRSSSHPGFITGRQAVINHNSQPIGIYGELHPQTITNFSLEHPVIGFEVDLSAL